jgi:Fur family ferric uptake transcriptional regulator
MQQIHKQEKEQFKKLFKEEKIDHFEDRFKVLESFLQTERHVTADELTERINQGPQRLEAPFVSETLELMCRYGFANKQRFDNGQVRYEHLHLGQHHDHLICTKCRSIIEFSNDKLENLQVKIAAAHGFHMLQHKMEIYGICAECLQSRSEQISLDLAKPGEQLIIKEIQGGAGARVRLLTMGLRPGDRIEVITNQRHGQMVIAIDNKRYVLGRGLTEKIIGVPQKRV